MEKFYRAIFGGILAFLLTSGSSYAQDPTQESLQLMVKDIYGEPLSDGARIKLQDQIDLARLTEDLEFLGNLHRVFWSSTPVISHGKSHEMLSGYGGMMSDDISSMAKSVVMLDLYDDKSFVRSGIATHIGSRGIFLTASQLINPSINEVTLVRADLNSHLGTVNSTFAPTEYGVPFETLYQDQTIAVIRLELPVESSFMKSSPVSISFEPLQSHGAEEFRGLFPAIFQFKRKVSGGHIENCVSLRGVFRPQCTEWLRLKHIFRAM